MRKIRELVRSKKLKLKLLGYNFNPGSILMFRADGVSYMIKAAKCLKVFLTQVHITCLAHALNRDSEKKCELSERRSSHRHRKEFFSEISPIKHVRIISFKCSVKVQFCGHKTYFYVHKNPFPAHDTT